MGSVTTYPAATLPHRVTATGGAESRTLADWMADVQPIRARGYAGQGVTVGWMGDSRTAANYFANPPRVNSGGLANWTEFFSRGRAFCSDPTLQWAVSGEDSEEILARVGSATASTADIVVLLSSVNDATGMASADNVEATLRAIVAAGKIAIVVPELPRIAGWTNARIRQHHAVRERCQDLAASLPNLYVADPWADMADVTTGGIASGLYYDVYVHLTKLGALYVGRAIAAVINTLFPAPSILPAVNVGGYDETYNPTGQMLANRMMLGTAGGKVGVGASGNVADSWVLTASADLTAVASKVTVDGAEWQQIVVSGTPTDDSQYVELAQNVPLAKMRIGDSIVACCDLSVDAGAANTHGPSLEIVGTGGSTSYVSFNYDSVSSTSLYAPNIAHAGILRTPAIGILTGLTSLKTSIKVFGNSGQAMSITFRVRAVGMRKSAANASGDRLPTPNVITRMSPAPDSTRQSLINALYAALQTQGVFYKLDGLIIPAAHAQQGARLNWVAAQYDLTEFNSPNWLADNYYQGNGTNMYLTTGFDPTIAGGLFSLNDAHMGVYFLSADGTSSISAFGNTTARIGLSGSAIGTRANDASSYTGSSSGVPSHGVWSRTSSGAYTRYKNGAVLGSAIGTASTAMTAAGFDVCRVGSTYTTNKIAALHWGGGLTDADVAELYTQIHAYLVAIGTTGA